MAPATKEAVTTFWQIAAFLGISVAFLLVGFEANIITFPQSILIIAAAFLAVTAARAATVYPILAFFRKISGKTSTAWSNIAMLSGVRGALSIALAATITTSALISQTDLRTIDTMVFGVAFISIVVQVPLIFRYARRKIPQDEVFTEEIDVDEQFELITSQMEEVRKLKSEGKISNEEFAKRIDASKRQLDELINKSPVAIETQKIIRDRASSLYSTFPKRPKRKKPEENKEEKSPEKSDSNS
jgi:hypothetical protein